VQVYISEEVERRARSSHRYRTNYRTACKGIDREAKVCNDGVISQSKNRVDSIASSICSDSLLIRNLPRTQLSTTDRLSFRLHGQLSWIKLEETLLAIVSRRLTTDVLT